MTSVVSIVDKMARQLDENRHALTPESIQKTIVQDALEIDWQFYKILKNLDPKTWLYRFAVFRVEYKIRTPWQYWHQLAEKFDEAHRGQHSVCILEFVEGVPNILMICDHTIISATRFKIPCTSPFYPEVEKRREAEKIYREPMDIHLAQLLTQISTGPESSENVSESVTESITREVITHGATQSTVVQATAVDLQEAINLVAPRKASKRKRRHAEKMAEFW